MQAMAAGDLAGLTGMLSADAASYSDGGGKVRAALNVVRGADPIARLWLGLQRRPSFADTAQREVREINGWPALVMRTGGQVQLVLGIETDGDKIYAMHVILNPDKLTRI